MPKLLRNLALTFENPEPDEFIWLIREGPVGGSDYPFEVVAAQEPYPTFEAAMRAGYDTLATMTYPDRARGPQVQVIDADDTDIPPERQEYRGRLIEVYAKRMPGGAFRSYVRLHIGVGTGNGWTAPVVPAPIGGFADLRDAIETAFTVAEMTVDGHEVDERALEEG